MMERYRILLILAAITVFSFLSVDILYKIVGAHLTTIKIPAISAKEYDSATAFKKPSPTTYHTITDRNLFGSTEKTKTDIQVDIEELEPTKLNLVLIGTVFSGGDSDYAVIEETDKRKQGLFKVGDAVASATVIKILRGTVVLRVDGKDEVLKMKEESGVTQTTVEHKPEQSSTITVSKADVDTAFQNVNEMLTQVRVRPYYSGGKPDGFMVSRIKQGSFFDKMGLRNGDVIQGVNGESIESAEKMLELYKGLRGGSEITVNIKRRGRKQDVKYVFQ